MTALLLATLLSARPQLDLVAQLKALPHVKEVQTRGEAPNETYTLRFEQPVDHSKPDGRKFLQSVYLRHRDISSPVILGTEGYTARGANGGELSRILPNPNIVTVEHRYFGNSAPDPKTWKDLTIKNSAGDLHEIVSSLKHLYKGKWVSTGASKGGQTALFFKTFYPNDVDATVAYVAPINLAQEDPRIYDFFTRVGTPEMRKKVEELQITLLKRRSEVLPLLKVNPDDYSMGVDRAYEYGVLEFAFAMWQYGTAPTTMPGPDSPAQELADAYKKVNSMYYYSDQGRKQFEPFYYQAYTEIGFYNYDITPFKPYLKSKNITNMDLCPPDARGSIVYNPETLNRVYHFLQYEAQNIILIYGESDPWSATALPLIGHTNGVRIMVKGAWHNANVRLASPDQRNEVYTALESWLGVTVNRFPDSASSKAPTNRPVAGPKANPPTFPSEKSPAPGTRQSIYAGYSGQRRTHSISCSPGTLHPPGVISSKMCDVFSGTKAQE